MRTRAAAGLALAAAVAAAIALAAHAASPARYDFVALYAAARLVAEGRGTDVTDGAALLEVEHALFPERAALLNDPNAPALALVMAPLGWLPYGAAYVLWLGIAIAALLGAIVLLAPLAAAPQRRYLAPLALLAPPSIIALIQGQTTPLALLAIACALRSRHARSGAALGGALLRAQVVPALAIAGLRTSAAVTAFAGVALAIAVASVGVSGAGIARWPERLAYAAGETGLGEVSLPALARRAGLDAGAALGLSLVLLIAAGLFARRTAAPLIVALPLALLAAPHALVHDLVLAYPSVAAVARRGRAVVAWALAVVLAVALQLSGWPGAQLWLAALAVASVRARR